MSCNYWFGVFTMSPVYTSELLLKVLANASEVSGRAKVRRGEERRDRRGGTDGQWAYCHTQY